MNVNINAAKGRDIIQWGDGRDPSLCCCDTLMLIGSKSLQTGSTISSHVLCLFLSLFHYIFHSSLLVFTFLVAALVSPWSLSIEELIRPVASIHSAVPYAPHTPLVKGIATVLVKTRLTLSMGKHAGGKRRNNNR